uniref:DNA-directed RNA polymerase n=1 Tax=Dictyopteris divaricata TaxID=156996 RepID=A0A2I4Q2J1_9PHAE|nr:DNA-directed RNA polymerase alpha chain [Dictyopteris divaricata]YP_010205352.1 DNA-directed RNA polymerase alpha chain [Grateloupia livida]AQZ25063.1 DNA-directed RNA polymerase alpha chain [Dictyopteris divaricata]UAV85921.1 DNA-directed RNA polymerase alpha chain [Grateloupia livida]
MPKKCICRELSLSNPTEFYGHFVFTSLDHAEGITLGNMVRRTLLSNLPGSKIVGVKISNVNHEFSDVEGIREDILEIFLNLKEVIIKNPLNYRVCYGKVKIQGPAIVTAGLILLPNDVLILNPQQYLFTISEQIFVELEVKIECGKSYILATERKLDNLGEFFPIDANFTPILNVEYHIQPVLDYVEKSREELHMIISTNGTLLPQEALLIATNNLSQLILGCRDIELMNLETKFVQTRQSNVKDKLIEDILKKEKRTDKNFEDLLLTNVLNGEKPEKYFQQSSDINQSKKRKSNLIKKKKKQIKLESKSNSLFEDNHKPEIYDNNKQKSLSKKNNLLGNILKKEEQGVRLNSEHGRKFLLGDKYLTNQPNVSEKNGDTHIIQTATKTLDLRGIDIEITCLPNRILTTLKKAKINVMADLLKYSTLELQKIKGLGPVSVKKIKDQVELFFEAISL